MSEENMIAQCAPTMAGIKTASLFGGEFSSRGEMLEKLRTLNAEFVPRGMRLIPLRYREGRALLYLFRPEALQRDMADATARRLLRERNYPVENCNYCIRKLIERMKKEKDFPHEIGLFLGYPPEDVEGFIVQGPRCAKCTGCWQVYGDEQAAKETFERFRCCTKRYQELFSLHHDLAELLRAAS